MLVFRKRRPGRDRSSDKPRTRLTNFEWQRRTDRDVRVTGPAFVTDWTTNGKWILISCDLQTPGRVALCLLPLDVAPHAETQMRVIASHSEYNLQIIIPNIVELEMALTSDRLILPMMEASGGIWVLENVD